MIPKTTLQQITRLQLESVTRLTVVPLRACSSQENDKTWAADEMQSEFAIH
jgi:hypothetical protein